MVTQPKSHAHSTICVSHGRHPSGAQEEPKAGAQAGPAPGHRPSGARATLEPVRRAPVRHPSNECKKAKASQFRGREGPEAPKRSFVQIARRPNFTTTSILVAHFHFTHRRHRCRNRSPPIRLAPRLAEIAACRAFRLRRVSAYVCRSFWGLGDIRHALVFETSDFVLLIRHKHSRLSDHRQNMR